MYMNVAYGKQWRGAYEKILVRMLSPGRKRARCGTRRGPLTTDCIQLCSFSVVALVTGRVSRLTCFNTILHFLYFIHSELTLRFILWANMLIWARRFLLCHCDKIRKIYKSAFKHKNKNIVNSTSINSKYVCCYPSIKK